MQSVPYSNLENEALHWEIVVNIVYDSINNNLLLIIIILWDLGEWSESNHSWSL